MKSCSGHLQCIMGQIDFRFYDFMLYMHSLSPDGDRFNDKSQMSNSI